VGKWKPRGIRVGPLSAEKIRNSAQLVRDSIRIEQPRVQKLPFLVHRLGSQKSPWMVSITDLAIDINAKKKAANDLWREIKTA